jgi:FixJ family two-component response regulator
LVCEPIVVYIVDDEAAIRQALARLMRSAGLRAETFASVTEVLDKGRLDEIACIVVDIRLPGVSGLELPQRLARLGYTPPVIVITAYDTDANRQAAHRAGAAAFFRKPVDGDALLDAITWVVETDQERRIQAMNAAVAVRSEKQP